MSLPKPAYPGERYGKLTVVAETVTPAGQPKGLYYQCRCDCGYVGTYKSTILRLKARTGGGCVCGSVRTEPRKHGMSGTRIYSTWFNMKRRCLDPNNDAYSNYGGRGITLCERWLSFEGFYADMGDPPSDDHTIERNDNDGPYSKDNCRWALRSEQNANTRSNHRIEYNGVTRHLAEWGRVTGKKEHTILYRLRAGWTIEDALTKPVRQGKYNGH